MQQRTSTRLYTYWNDVRKGRIAPCRFDIEPARLADILPEIFMLERNTQTCYRFRLAGTRMCEYFQAEFRGNDFLEGWCEADRFTLEHYFSEITDRGAAALFTLECKSEDGKAAMFEMMILPLVHTQNTIDRYLGSMSPLNRPDWLGRTKLVEKKLVRHELIWPEGRPHALVERSNSQLPFLPHIRSARIVRNARRQFRVYDGGLSKSDNE